MRRAACWPRRSVRARARRGSRAQAHRHAHPVRLEHGRGARRPAGGGRERPRRRRPLSPRLRGVPAAAARASERAEHGAARAAAPGARAVRRGLGQASARCGGWARRSPGRSRERPRGRRDDAADRRLVGTPAAAAGGANPRRSAIQAASRGIRKRPSVLVILGVGRTPYAFMPNSWGGDVVRRAGGRLLTDGLRANGGYARISDEVIVVTQPRHHHRRAARQPEDIPRLAAYMRTNPAWRTHEGGAQGPGVRLDGQLAAAAVDGRRPDDPRRPRKFLHN